MWPKNPSKTSSARATNTEDKMKPKISKPKGFIPDALYKGLKEVNPVQKEPTPNPYAAYEKPFSIKSLSTGRVCVRESCSQRQYSDADVYSVEFTPSNDAEREDEENGTSDMMRMGCVTMTVEEAWHVVDTLSQWLNGRD